MTEEKLAAWCFAAVVAFILGFIGLDRLFSDDWAAGRRGWMANKSAIDPKTGKPWED